MILAFGTINAHVQTYLDEKLALEATTQAQNSMLGISGNSAVQAISAARCGAKVSLIGTIGNDVYAEYCLDLLRKEGINTSGIAKSDTDTGLEISLVNPNRKITTTVSTGANQHNNAEQIPDIHLNERSLLLITDHTDEGTLLSLLHRIRKRDGKSILCINRTRKISPDTLSHADIIIMDENNTRDISNKGIYALITKNSGVDGASLYTDNNQEYDYSSEDSTDVNDINGCFDVFCGFFAACIQAGLPIKRSITFACKASLTASQTNGIYNAIPYLGHIEDIDDKNAKIQNY